jgi:hypothetical protein
MKVADFFSFTEMQFNQLPVKTIIFIFVIIRYGAIFNKRS